MNNVWTCGKIAFDVTMYIKHMTNIKICLCAVHFKVKYISVI